MIRHRMRLVERLIEEDSGDFVVEAPTPALAAGILLRAHDAARERCSNLVSLPDGQSCHINPTNVVETRTFCIVLDEEGQEIKEVDPKWPGPEADEQQHGAGADNGAAQTNITESKS